MLYLKPEVITEGVVPQIWFALGVALELMDLVGQRSLTVNSLRDGAHMAGSLHYEGKAADIHTVHLGDNARRTFNYWLKEALDPLGFDIVEETTPVHTHIEFQPKAGEFFTRPTGEDRRGASA